MLHHVTNEVLPAHLEQCIAFYETLGFRPVTTPEGIAGRAIWLERGATQVHLMPREGAAGPRAGHFAVVVDRYEATVERLRAEGHEVEDRRPHWGSPRSYVRDPAGHLVELMAWPPGGRG
jgi:catechol 2,3-dioxygenase-like lactoylglutathione lyase family enzyme